MDSKQQAAERAKRRAAQKEQDRMQRDGFKRINHSSIDSPAIGLHPLGGLSWWKTGFQAGQSDGPLDYTLDPVDLWGGQKKTF